MDGRSGPSAEPPPCSALSADPAAQEFGDLGVGKSGEAGELVGAQAGTCESPQHIAESTALVVQGGGEAVDAFLAVLEVHCGAHCAQGIVEEHGEEPIPGVATSVGIRRLGRGPGREHLRDRGGDAVARPGRRRGLAPPDDRPMIDRPARANRGLGRVQAATGRRARPGRGLPGADIQPVIGGQARRRGGPGGGLPI